MEVDVLLATYNGEKYIEEFLNSLIDQVGVQINLYVSDDNSSDSTIEIISRFSAKFARCVIIKQNRNLGPAANFHFLCTFGKSEFVAFADQDDIWISNKLLESINLLQKHNKKLIVSQICTFEDTSLKTIPIGKPFSYLFNYSYGCTMVFKRTLKNQIANVKIDNFVMHDWLAILLAQKENEIFFSKDIFTFYRTHESNYIYRNRSYLNLYRKIFGIPKRIRAAYTQFRTIKNY